MAEFVEEEEKICRYCFDGEESGELISPCKCTGGQKWVHLDCLRRWQRMVIVNQPTHPAYHQDDVRHHKCNVCLSEYTCPPPTRGELMESFTGPEIAALLFPGRIISSRDIFSDNLERDVQNFNPTLRSMSGYDHWIRGVYLITKVESDDPEKVLELSTRSNVTGLLSRLEDDSTLMFHGQRLRLINAGSLSHVPADGDLRQALMSVSLPATIVLRVTTPITCADDHIVAVNIARCVPNPIVPMKYEPIFRSACQHMPSVSSIEVKHYIGGPVEELEIMTCIVTGGAKGWTIVPTLKKALYLAATRCQKKDLNQGDILSGQRVTLTGLIARPELNGKVGMVLRFLPEPQRWEVQLTTGEGLKVKPINLTADGTPSRVMVFWGDARWSRAQLLGETARGHWGLCRATVGEFISSPQEVWLGTLTPNRLAFAPISAMTDELLSRLVAEGGAARQEMEAAFQTAAGARSALQAEEEEESESSEDHDDHDDEELPFEDSQETTGGL